MSGIYLTDKNILTNSVEFSNFGKSFFVIPFFFKIHFLWLSEDSDQFKLDRS